LKGLRKASAVSPDGSSALDEAYKKAIERIQRQRGDLPRDALLIFSWIVNARRQITVPELRDALAVEIGKSALDEDNIPTVEHIAKACAPLIVVDEESSIIRLVHYTTQEYFERTQNLWFPNAQRDITTTCVTYLSFDAFEAGFCPTDKEFKARLQQNPLYDYAARNWGHHACVASTEVGQLILNFLENEAKVSGSSQAMMASRGYSVYSQDVPRQMTGVHLAAYFGLTGVIMALLKNRHNPDVKDFWGRTPLWWATEKGHEAVVKLLLEKGAELESKDKWCQTPLSWAAERGDEAVVKLLLEKGAELESKDKDEGRTPLSWAAERGHEAVVKLLLEKGAELESEDKWGQTPLWRAAVKGHEGVVKLLTSIT
jgi:Ankyrin repeats (3 copies)/Ankyrin repeats (many copies)